MKKIAHRMNKITLATGLLVALCLLFSCTKMSLVESYEGAVGTGTLSIRASVKGDSLAQGGDLAPSRAIAPSQVTEQELAQYTLRLSGHSQWQNLQDQVIRLTDGGATLTDIPNGTWQLRLVALTQAGEEVLEGVSAVTIENDKTSEAKFILTPVDGGTGSVRVGFTLDNADFAKLNPNTDKVHIALYNADDYTLETSTEQTPTLTQNIVYNLNAVSAGVYILRFTITAEAGSNFTENSCYTWASTIYVESHMESTDTVSLKYLFQKPSEPTNPVFTNESGTNATDVVNVHLTWTGVYNANSYELEVLDYSGSYPLSQALWTTAETTGTKFIYNAIPDSDNNYTKHANKFASQYYRGEGGLLPGQNSIKLGLQVGSKQYAARIRAVNEYGPSDWTYFLAPNPRIPTRGTLATPSSFRFAAGHYDGDSESFYTNFTWGSVAEADGYELELMTIKSSHSFTPPRNDTQWSTLASNQLNTWVSYKGSNLGDSNGDPCQYKGGSLLAGSTSAQVSIKRHAGKEYYVVRLRAYSDDGRESGWQYPNGIVHSARGTHPMLLMPIPSFSYTSTPADSNGNFTANITIQDHPGSTCYYHYEFIHLSPRDFSSIFRETNLSRKNDIFRGFYNDGNPHGNSRLDVLTPRFSLSGLRNGGVILIRLRILTQSGGGTRSATPWYYATKTLLPGQTDVRL